jgi:general secretion pathway protein M
MRLSPLASRLIAWGLLANLCWVIGAFIAVPLLRQINNDRETIATSRELLARYRRFEADLPLIQGQFEELQGKSDGNRYFFASTSPALAAAEMQNTIRGLVSGSGAVLRSNKSLQPAIENGLDRVGIDLEVTASSPEMVKLLRAIAAAEPIILIERLLAQVPETGGTATASDGQPAVALTLRLVAYTKHAQGGTKS